jgi:hypothetical protein
MATFATLTANGSTPVEVRHSDVVVTVIQNTGTALVGNLAVEEWVPGKGWVTRATLTGVGTTTYPANKTDPTRWRTTMAGYSAGSWGVAIR